MIELRARLEARRRHLWDALKIFMLMRDAHGVHDMAVEIQGIEIMLKELRE